MPVFQESSLLGQAQAAQWAAGITKGLSIGVGLKNNLLWPLEIIKSRQNLIFVDSMKVIFYK